MAQNGTAETLTRLEAEWPDWQIWTVPRAIGGTIWCARRRDGAGDTLNTFSAGELADSLRARADR